MEETIQIMEKSLEDMSGRLATARLYDEEIDDIAQLAKAMNQTARTLQILKIMTVFMKKRTYLIVGVLIFLCNLNRRKR